MSTSASNTVKNNLPFTADNLPDISQFDLEMVVVARTSNSISFAVMLDHEGKAGIAYGAREGTFILYDGHTLAHKLMIDHGNGEMPDDVYADGFGKDASSQFAGFDFYATLGRLHELYVAIWNSARCRMGSPFWNPVKQGTPSELIRMGKDEYDAMMAHPTMVWALTSAGKLEKPFVSLIKEEGDDLTYRVSVNMPAMYDLQDSGRFPRWKTAT